MTSVSAGAGLAWQW